MADTTGNPPQDCAEHTYFKSDLASLTPDLLTPDLPFDVSKY